MEGDYRSRSFNDGMMQMEVYGARSTTWPPPPPPPGPHDFRSYSTSHAYSYNGGGYGAPSDFKGKADYGASSSSNKGGWVFSDPEFQRKRRVASYKAYAVEGKVKGSLRRSFRWLKDKYSRVVYGLW
ncbi:hypothetical protein Cni_G04472 [Canna indica]|uniref:DUF3511 domain protein n=1 Tax=Canna indica TaxID=4628 RepID=A0AAQ3JX31_9LILI|nr:hypothetical protein Cni_G04472 [Canna indica]